MHRLLLLLAACGPDAPTCPEDSLPFGETVVLGDTFAHDGTDGTEGIAFSPDGRLFVTGSERNGSGWVGEVHPDGTWTLIAELTGSVGLTWWHDELVVAAGDVGDGSGGLFAVDVDTGDVRVLAAGIPGANFPVVTPWDTLLVAGPGGEALYEVTSAGDVSTWATDIPSPNGLVFDASGTVLYVAQTYGDANALRRVEVVDGQAGAVTDVVVMETGSTQDGVGMDADGGVLVLLNLPGELVRITDDGVVNEISDEVPWAASLAFGVGDWDPCSVYVTSLFDPTLFRVGVGRPAGAWTQPH